MMIRGFNRQQSKTKRRFTVKNSEFKTFDGVPVYTLYVTNIPISNQRGVYHLLSKYGKIFHYFIKQQSDPKKQTTYAFVTFATSNEAYLVYKSRFHIKLKNVKLFIHVADSWHQPQLLSDGTLQLPSRKFHSNASSSGTTDEETEEEVVVQKMSPSEEDNYKSVPIYKLNDDCLRHIFSYLHITERLLLDKVCVRWKSITDEMWSSTKELNLSKPPVSKLPLTNSLLASLLKKCKNVKNLNLCTEEDSKINSAILIDVARNCPNLCVLKFSFATLRDRSLVLIGRYCPNLLSIEIKDCHLPTPKDLISFIKRCKNLQSITLRRIDFRKFFPWLLHLKPPLKSLCLEGCIIQGSDLVKGLRNVSSTLRELSFSLNKALANYSFESLLEEVPDLESFTLLSSYYTTKSASLNKIFSMRNLRRLSLERCDVVSDSFLKGLAKNCPLIEHLNLTDVDNSSFTKDGLNSVIKLTNLTYLNLNYNSKIVDDSFLKSLSNSAKKLSELHVAGCSKLSDVGCTCIVSSCCNLRILNVCFCTHVTNLTVIAACNSRSESKTLLEVMATGSGIDMSKDWNNKDVSVVEGRVLSEDQAYEFHHVLMDEILEDLNGFEGVPLHLAVAFGDYESDIDDPLAFEYSDDEDYDDDDYDDIDAYGNELFF